MPRYDDLAAFAEVVRAGSFTRAAARIGVTQSALSQTIRTLEKRLDQRLLNRTTRSVAPTEAGERLFQVVDRRLADIDDELSLLAERRGKPAGTIRITATVHAVRSLVWPRLQPWLPRYPDIRIEISSDNRFTDIVADRFDIGVRLGGDVAKDMIATRIAPDLKMAVVGSPAYFTEHAPPRTPKDLVEHDCIALRLPTHGGLMTWEFRRDRQVHGVAPRGRLVFNASELAIDAALAGYGLAWVPAELVEDALAAGTLVAVLDRHAVTYPGYHAYYATRRASPALTLVIEALRRRDDASRPST